MDGTSAKTTNEEAARWVVRLDAGALSEAEQRELDAWLEAAPHHRGALIRAHAAWTDLDRVGALAGGSIRTRAEGSSSSFAAPGESRASDTSTRAEESAATLPLSPSVENAETIPLSPLGERAGVRGSAARTRRWLLAASVAGFAVLGTSWLVLRSGGDVYESGIGEVRRVTLADGSSMVLNTASRAIVRFDRDQRQVRLERGEALFQVHKDASRPFIVRTEGLTVRAVGTAFSVRLAEARVDVTVTEGVVEVARAARRTLGPDAIEAPLRVVANHRAIAIATEPVAIEPIEPSTAERQLAWRSGMVAFDGEPLSEAVAEINRHSERQIVIDDPSLSARPVVGIFRASDVEAFAQAAATALGAEVVTEGETIHLAPAKAR